MATPMTATPPNLDALRRNDAFLRVVARSLARDDAEADDLLQDARLRVLKAADVDERRTGPRGVRAWLAAVVRSAAASLARGSSRRERRERTSASGASDVGPSAAELAERMETGRRVAHAVLALDPPLRDAVLLRWYEGLPPREAAVRLAVPVETLRSRLKRAHAELRSRLAKDYGSAEGLAAALLPFTGAFRGAVGVDGAVGGGGTAAVAIGGTLMTTKTKAVAGIIFAVVVAAAWRVAQGGRGDLLRSDPTAGTASQARLGAAPAATAVLSARDRAVDSAPFAESATDSAPTGAAKTGRLVVRLLDADRAPIAGATVVLYDNHRPRGCQPRCATSAAGVAVFEDLPPGSYAVSHPASFAFGAWTTVSAGSTAETELVVPTGATVEGFVRDESGAAVPGAIVYVSSFGGFPTAAGRAGDDGAYRVAFLHRQVNLSAFADGFVPATAVNVDAFPGQIARRELVLRRASEVLRGKVVDAHGAPLIGVAVFAAGSARPPRPEAPWASETSRQATTGPDGGFAIPIDRRERTIVTAWRPGFAITETVVDAGSEPLPETVLRLVGGGRLVGRMEFGTGAGSRPTADERMSVKVVDSELLERWTPAAPDRTFVVEHVAPGTRKVEARWGAASRTEALTFVDGGDTRWDPVFELVHSVRGRVVTASGRPLEKIYVGVKALGGGSVAGRPYCGNWTDAEGRFELAEVKAARVRVEALAHGGARIASKYAAVDGAEVALTVPDERRPSARFGGIVKNDDGSIPKDAKAWIEDLFDSWSLPAPVDPSTGTFLSDALTPGEYRVRVDVGDKPFADVGAFRIAGDETKDLGTIRGNWDCDLRIAASDEDGRPFENFRVEAHRCDGPPLASAQGARGQSSLRVPRNRLRVFAYSDDGRRWCVRFVDATPGAAVRLELRATELSKIRVLVPDLGANEETRLFQLVRNTDGEVVSSPGWYARVKAEGIVPSYALTPGSYELEARDEDGRTGKLSFTVPLPAGAAPPQLTITAR